MGARNYALTALERCRVFKKVLEAKATNNTTETASVVIKLAANECQHVVVLEVLA